MGCCYLDGDHDPWPTHGPAFDVRLSRCVTNPLVVATQFLGLALVLSNAAAHFPPPPGRDGESHQVLGILSGLFGGLGLFCAVIGCARYVRGVGSVPPAANVAAPPQDTERTP